MTDNEYLDAVLREQTLVPGGAELTELERQRKNVVAILDKKVGNARPTVRKGGSLAKGTMNLEVYDLDLPTYFAYDEDGAGETLEEIYNTVADAMSEDYFVERRRSALRLRNNDGKVDTHIDLVPGRFFDASEGDACGQIDRSLDYVFRLLAAFLNILLFAVVLVRTCPSSFFDKRNKVLNVLFCEITHSVNQESPGARRWKDEIPFRRHLPIGLYSAQENIRDQVLGCGAEVGGRVRKRAINRRGQSSQGTHCR